MSADVLAGGVIVVFAALAVYAWAAVRASSRAATLEDIAARMVRDASKARAAGTTVLQRTADFAYYDSAADVSLPHVMCLAMQDVILEAELNGCMAVDTPHVSVDLDRKLVRVELEVLRVDDQLEGVAA